jgi:hypothetical protein
MVSMTGLSYGARNADDKGRALQCHFLALLHALLPVKAVREAVRLLAHVGGADRVLMAVSQLAEPRRAVVDLRERESDLSALQVFPSDWWNDVRDAVDTAAFLFDAVEQHGGQELTSLFLGRKQAVRVPLHEGCRAAPEAARDRVDAVNILGNVTRRWFVVLAARDLGVAGGQDGVPWLHFGLGGRVCDQCNCTHPWAVRWQMLDPPAVLLVEIEGEIGMKAWIPLDFRQPVAEGDEVHYHLVSIERSLLEHGSVRHYVALVRKENRGQSWIRIDDTHYTQNGVPTVRDGWLYDSARIAVYAREDTAARL